MMNDKYVICINNKGYEVSLTLHKVYQVLADPEAEEDGMIRVIDDTGEDYLFGEQRFVAVELPAAAAESFARMTV
jgi:hypothetical protein